MEKLTIEDLGYVEEMRQRLGVDENSTELDDEILAMEPLERVKLITAWYFGSSNTLSAVKSYLESQGIYLTTNHEDSGIIWEN